MKSNLVAALGEAMRLTRGRNLSEAARVIEDALRRDGGPGPSTRPSRKPLDGFAFQSGRQWAGLPRGFKGKMPGVRPPMTLRDGEVFASRSFAGAAATLAYKLFVPRLVGRPSGLLVMLHGCTQDPDDFAAGTAMNQVAREHNFVVAYPAQSRTGNTSLCWNWFEPGNQKRGQGEPALIAGLTQALAAEFGIDRRRVFIAGLSAGGAMAAVLAAAYPELYAAVGVHSGLECGAAHDVASAFAAMAGGTAGGGLMSRHATTSPSAVRTIVFHGDADHTVHPSNGERIVIAAKAGEPWTCEETLTGRSEGGIEYHRAIAWNGDGLPLVEYWVIHGAGHAWSGGSADGTYTFPQGPDASREMVRFFLAEGSAI